MFKHTVVDTDLYQTMLIDHLISEIAVDFVWLLN